MAGEWPHGYWSSCLLAWTEPHCESRRATGPKKRDNQAIKASLTGYPSRFYLCVRLLRSLWKKKHNTFVYDTAWVLSPNGHNHSHCHITGTICLQRTGSGTPENFTLLSFCMMWPGNDPQRPSLTSVSWSSALAVCTRESWPAGWTLLARWSWGPSPTRLTRGSGYCSDWHCRLDGDLVQYGVVARQVACNRWDSFNMLHSWLSYF